MPGQLLRDFDCCPSCGSEHAAIALKYLESPKRVANYVGRCPRTSQSIYLKLETETHAATAHSP